MSFKPMNTFVFLREHFVFLCGLKKNLTTKGHEGYTKVHKENS